MRRRQFMALLGGAAAAWPLAAHAQQAQMPVVGFLNASSAVANASRVAKFHEGLRETGYVESQNVLIEYRWAEGRYDRLADLAADLVQRKVSVIVTGANADAALAVKAKTDAIPLVFGTGDDPVRLGLVASLSRPGGNATGVSFFSYELGAKRLGILRELVPAAALIAVLANPNSTLAHSTEKELQVAAASIGQQLEFLKASSNHEIDQAVAKLVEKRAAALLTIPDAFFTSRRMQIATLAVRHAVPAIYPQREYLEVGGLMSYGASIPDAYRQLGLYAGRIMKGEKPADLPVQQPTKFELIINLVVAKALGLTVPDALLARADEVIE